MSFKKILASMLAVVAACGMSAAALTLDSAEAANEAVLAEEAVLADGELQSIIGYTGSNDVWGECGGPAKESFELKVYSEDTLIGTATLNNIDGIIDGDVYVTWHLKTIDDGDAYWTYSWETSHPRVDCPPTKVELWIDGAAYATGPVKSHGPDGLNPIKWADVKGVYNPYINGVYLGGSYDKAYLCTEIYDFYLKETFVAKFSANGAPVAEVALNPGKLSGKIDVIGCCLGFDGDFDEYWKTTWLVPATTANMPDFVEIYVDGVKLAEKAGPFGNGIKGWDPASNGNWLYELVAEDYMNIKGVSGVAAIGSTQFVTLQAAFDAAKDGDEIDVLFDFTIAEEVSVSSGYTAGVYYTGDKNFTLDLNNNTITVDGPNNNGLRFRNFGTKDNTVTIKNGTVDVNNAWYAIDVGGSAATAKTTLNLLNVTVKSNKNNGYTVSAWVNGLVNAENVTIESYYAGGFIAGGGEMVIDNCDVTITGAAAYPFNSVAVAASSGTGKATVNSGNYKVVSTAADSSNLSVIGVMSSGGELIINGGTFTQEDELNRNRQYYLAYCDNGTGEAPSKLTVNGGTFTAISSFSQWNSQYGKNFALTLKGGSYNVNPVANITKLADGYTLISNTDGFYKVVAENQIVNEVSVVFQNPVKTEETATYDIVIKASNDGIINRLNTADLVFDIDSDKVVYEIAGANGITVTNEAGTERYMFNFDGKPEGIADTANEIVIGTVTFTGYDAFNFGVVEADTNLVTATTLMDNIVDYFDPDGKLENGTAVGKLVIGNGLTDEIIVPTRLLTINIAFPNEVVENTPAEQQMTVTVSGGDLAEAIIVDLGNKTFTGATGTDDTVVYDGSYKVVLANELTKNITYNVVVSGAGYRTARYTVTMTDAKTLNFWNNVKDNKVEVEEGKASSATEKNFLAGDIVADNQINIYDLSAVVSYFATSTSADYEKYTKYDLNRDGTIDSKDVAYVLVSWGE